MTRSSVRFRQAAPRRQPSARRALSHDEGGLQVQPLMRVVFRMPDLLDEEPSSDATHLLARLRHCRESDLAVPGGSVVVVADDADVVGNSTAAVGEEGLNDAESDQV